ncbi:elongation factor [Rhynchospora pubera]|uniref:Uncharacterized protein n=2 Tax=Rhynchospora TaxID=46332 RepID=A0A9Q0HHZ6_9POAL|nr:hypothetical protein LUZ63_018374 [Rhynchospora breviuscula]KAJ4750727.1 elongation factor [Rhynchospora pubera]KAJ4796331.1 elongation factor [Rhynchospora pubera]
MGYWWDHVIFPLRRVWTGVATRLGIRKTGLRRLRQEVSTCEYEDVHVMWEMLSRTDTSIARPSRPTGNRRLWARREWTQFSFCRSF